METNNVHILFIDDEPDVIQEAEVWLKKEFGYQNLKTATSAQEAKEKLEQESFDIIVSDMRMERGDSGFEILDLVGEHKSALVIILTANETVEDCRRAFNIGAWDYIPKSTSGKVFETLHESIQEAILHLNQWGNPSNEKWLAENKQKIEDDHWGQYIAITNKEVIESADTEKELNELLNKRPLRHLTTTLRRIGDLRPIGELVKYDESTTLEFKRSLYEDVNRGC